MNHTFLKLSKPLPLLETDTGSTFFVKPLQGGLILTLTQNTGVEMSSPHHGLMLPIVNLLHDNPILIPTQITRSARISPSPGLKPPNLDKAKILREK